MDLFERNTQCPWCLRINELHAGVEHAKPEDGDRSVCWGCGGLGVFLVNELGQIHIRRANKDEFLEFASDEAGKKFIAAFKASFTPTQAVTLVRGTNAHPDDGRYPR